MRTELRIIAHQLEGAEQNLQNVREGAARAGMPRVEKEAWMRLWRYTFDDNEVCIKQELGVLGYRGGEFEVKWKEVQRGIALTTIAPLNDYIIWMPKEET